MSEMTKAALAAQLQAETAGGGGNGVGEPSSEHGDFGLPPGIESLADTPVAPQTGFGRKPRATPPQSPSGVQAKLNQALPPPQQVRISKRLEGGKHAFIGEYGPNEIGTEPGAWQVFIKRHLKTHLTDRENWFLIESIDAQGKLRNHGEHCIIGEQPVVPPVAPMATPFAPPQPAETARDHIATIREMEELAEQRRKAWRDEQAQIRRETEEAQAALEAATKSKGDPIMTLLMTQMFQQRKSEPPREPRLDADFIDRRIERQIAPLAQSMTAGLNGLSERMERVAQAMNNPPPAPPPAPDPFKAISELVTALKPAPPPPPPPPDFSMRDLIQMQRDQMQRDAEARRDADARMEKLMLALKPEPQKEQFGLRDYIDMQQRQEDRTQRILDRIEQSTEKRLSDLKELQRDRKPEKGPLEVLREAKEIARLLQGEAAPSGLLEKGFEAITDPNFWEGFGSFIAQVKSGPMEEGEEDDDGQESPPIEVHESASSPPPQQPTQASTASTRQPASSSTRSAAVKPADLGKTDYPAEMEPVVKQLAEIAANDATTPEQVQQQILGVVACLEVCRRHSPDWNRRIVGGLQRVAFGGPKQVIVWFGPFLRGLSSSGKIPLATRERLEKLVSEQAEMIVQYLRSKMRGAGPKSSPSK